MTAEPTPILTAQQARLLAAGAEATHAWWEISPGGAGPAALESARRDLSLLAALPAGNRLHVLEMRSRADGGLEAEVPWASADQGLDAIFAAEGPLPLPRVLALGRGLCAALAALHQQGLVHGGLQPRLVRVPPPGVGPAPAADPYPIGAGWAALRVAWAARGEVDPAVLRYLAPEMLRGQASKPDRQADLFGLGALLFEALTGRPLFPGDDAEAVRQAILRPERPDLRQELGPGEEQLARVLRRCLQAEPADRFPSATALWRELAPALGGKATPLPPLHDPGGRPVEVTLTPPPDAPLRAPPSRDDEAPAPSPAPAIRPPRWSLRSSPGLFTAIFTVTAATIALVAIVAVRRGADPEPPSDPLLEASFSPPPGEPSQAPGRGPGAHGDGGPAGASDPAHAVPPPVTVDPRTARLRAALARVGLTEEEVLVSELLRRHVDRALGALRDQDHRVFDEAMRPVELATRPRECPRLLRLKRNYVIGGIRTLGPRLTPWERFRLERMLGDADTIPGPCPRRSALLRPLVLEIHDRLAWNRTRGLK